MEEHELRELAFEIWAFQANRRMKRVQEELADRGYEVEEAELNRWAAEGEWAINVRSKLEMVIPDLENRTWTSMALAEEQAANYLFAVTSGNMWPESPDWAEDIDPSLIKVRATVAKDILHMTGWSPTGLNVKERPKDPYNLKRDKPLEEMSYEELLALEKGRVEDEMERKLEQTDKVRKKRRG